METNSFWMMSGRDLGRKVEEVSRLQVERALELRCHMTNSTITLFTYHFHGAMMPYLDQLTNQDGYD